MQGAIEAGFAESRIFLYDDLLEAEILDAETAVTLVGPNQKVVVVAHLAEHLAMREAGLAPRLTARKHFLL